MGHPDVSRVELYMPFMTKIKDLDGADVLLNGKDAEVELHLNGIFPDDTLYIGKINSLMFLKYQY